MVLALDGRAPDIEKLAELPRLQFLWVSRVSQAAAESIGELNSLQRLVIHDLGVSDMAPFGKLSDLRMIAVAGSPKIRSLDGLQAFSALGELILFDNSNFDDLDPLRSLKGLESLCLEGGFSKPLRLQSLAPLSELAHLVRLRLASVRVLDGSLEPLQALHQLRDVFIADTFPNPA